MFSIETKSENGFEVVVLKDNAGGSSASVIPACGGILHAFDIPLNGGMLNIVDQYSNKKEFDDQLEVKGFKGCKLSPFACRLRDGKYHFGEKEYTIEKFYLGKHALHGLIYDAAFDVVRSSADTESASVELLYSYKAGDKGYPFKYDCRVVYELKKNNSLTISTFIKNHEGYAIPVSDGWHPYFTFGNKVDELLLSFQSREMLEFDAELIPTKEMLPYAKFKTPEPIAATQMDNAFVLDFEGNEPLLILRDENKRIQLEVQPARSYPILQLYIPDHRQSIAIENLSAAPDAFNNGIGLTTLQGGAEAVFTTNYTVRRF